MVWFKFIVFNATFNNISVVSWRSVDLQLPVRSVLITNKVVSSNPIHGDVYSMQHYVIKFVSDLRSLSPGTPVSSSNKTDLHDTTEILLKVALNTINLNQTPGESDRKSLTNFIT
jgi:hypothetical protein